MTTAVATPPGPTPHVAPPRRFDNAAEWVHALGDIPLNRIIFDPWPGTATEADLLRFVERDKRLCELIDGTLVEKRLGYWEAQIAIKLATRLGAYVDDHDLGALSGADSTLRMASSNRIRLPDLAFISKNRLPKTRAPVPVVSPDLVVEVISEGNTPAEMGQKLREYFDSGTRLAWYVYPRSQTVAVYRSADEPPTVVNADGSLDGGDVVPGFTIRVAELFRNIPPFE